MEKKLKRSQSDKLLYLISISFLLIICGCLEKKGKRNIFDDLLFDFKHEIPLYQSYLEFQNIKSRSLLKEKISNEFDDYSSRQLMSYIDKHDTVSFRLLLMSKIKRKYHSSYYSVNKICPVLRFKKREEVNGDTVVLEMFMACDNSDNPIKITGDDFTDSLVSGDEGSFEVKIPSLIFDEIDTVSMDIKLGAGVISVSFKKKSSSL